MKRKKCQIICFEFQAMTLHNIIYEGKRKCQKVTEPQLNYGAN